jgi:hypothetical protein
MLQKSVVRDCLLRWRQGILHLRAGPRKTQWGEVVISVLAVLMLVIAILVRER